MVNLIKKILREESEENVQKFIENRNKMLIQIEKTLPKLIEFLSENLKEYGLYDIDVKDVSVGYGSTWIYNKKTGKEEVYSGKSKIIILTFVKLGMNQSKEVKRIVLNYIEDIFGIPIMEYGTPLNLKFINLIEVEF